MNNNQNQESENKSMLEFLQQEFKTSDTGEIQRKLSKLDKQQQQQLKAKYEQWKEAKKKKQATKAAHGAKLDYVKSLKHICPEGQELYYFKKGGNLECGCKGKKMKEGAKIVEKAEGGTVAKFKQGKKNVVVNGSTKQPMLDAKAKEESERKARIERDRKSLEDYEKGTYGNSDNPPDSKAMAKSYINKYTKKKEKGGTVKAFKAKCGSKMKKHQQGGSLNGIPFYQEGTSEGGLKEIKLPKYMQKKQIGYPSILPGRYTGLERVTPSMIKMFKTWVKGLPKTLTPMDYISAGAGAATGIGLGYDDTHNQHVRKWITNTEKSLQPLPQTPSKPFIEFIKK